MLASVKIQDDPIVSSHRIMSRAIEIEGAELCAHSNPNIFFLCVVFYSFSLNLLIDASLFLVYGVLAQGL